MKILSKFLGVFDIFVSICFWLFYFYNFLSQDFILILAFLLLIKGVAFTLAFSLDIASIGDIFSAGVIFFSFFTTLPTLVALIPIIYLLQKGIFSLF